MGTGPLGMNDGSTMPAGETTCVAHLLEVDSVDFASCAVRPAYERNGHGSGKVITMGCVGKQGL